MPSIFVGDGRFKSATFKPEKNLNYEYSDGLDLTPGSKLHDKIRDEVMQRSFASSRVMSNRHEVWNEIDHTLTAYISIDEKEQLVKDSDKRRPVSVVFPYSYTILETLLSYYVAAFLQDPIFRYEGVSGEDVIGAILLEKLIAFQCIKNKVGLALHTQARDAFAYGFGVVTPTWHTEYGNKSIIERSGGFLGIGQTSERVIIPDQLLFEGNALENIDPYLYLPDPSVPIHDPQKGEFVGWLFRTNYMSLLSQEKNDEDMFNVRYLRQLQGRKTSIIIGDNSGRDAKSGMSTYDNQYQTDTKSTATDVVRQFIRLIPEEWELGDSEYPELWYFEIASDDVVIKAKPAGLDHDKYPIGVVAPDYDGYSLTPISRIEMLSGMQGVLDFMFNSHVANVRKAINDMIIYDPYLVNSNDLKNPSPGKLIRLRRPAWGRGVKDVATQLGITDITRGNMADSGFIVNWMDRISAADSSMQGALRQGGPERLTGQEFQGTRAGGVNRLERIARVVGMQGMQDIGTFFGLHAQQMMSQETYVKIAGDWQEVLMSEYGKSIDRGRLKVSPFDIDVMHDVIIRDGSVPGGNYSDVWVKLFGILGKTPELAQRFDIVRIFTHIARNLGAKNVNDFVRKGGNINQQTLPDETVRQQAQAGNIIPINQQGGAV